MTLQNRVLPTGEIVADPARGTLMGNRGILHDEKQWLGTTRWKTQAWLTCRLEFKGRKRPIMTPGRYTELFFLDEATALAAGHRPCGECRRHDLSRFRAAWEKANGTTDLNTLDRQMHRDRVTRRREQVRHDADVSTLPDGTFILEDGVPHVVWQGRLLRYSPAGYTEAHPLSSRTVTVLAPACTVAALARGYRPGIHSSANSLL